MRIFKTSNYGKDSVCPICKTSKDGFVTLIPILGTEEGHTAEASQVHVGCLSLCFDTTYNIIYQKIT